jgi:serine protease
MSRRFFLLLALSSAAALAGPAAACARDFVPGEVVVRYEDGTTRAERVATQAATGTGTQDVTAPQTRVLDVRDGDTVAATVRELRDRPDVEYAAPNMIARTAAFFPDDPGRGGAGDWKTLQWNFLETAGINAPQAWSNARAAKAPGARGVTIAVLDTGIAYSNRGRYRQAPDLAKTRFVSGYDFVAGDPYPFDQNGHGTFVTGILAQSTDNGSGVTGLAYRARIMPVRVLDSRGEGTATDIEKGIRFAIRKRVDVINLSLEFGTEVRASEIPGIIGAIRDANRAGIVMVAASGNEGERTIAYPARATQVIAVGATTENKCLADYSNGGTGLDIVAPGGGPDANLQGDANCKPFSGSGREITQQTFKGSTIRRFGLRTEEGTSMASPHVAAAAAYVIATQTAGANPSPAAVEARLKATARDLGAPGPDASYGAGLVDLAAATSPT